MPHRTLAQPQPNPSPRPNPGPTPGPAPTPTPNQDELPHSVRSMPEYKKHAEATADEADKGTRKASSNPLTNTRDWCSLSHQATR